MGGEGEAADRTKAMPGSKERPEELYIDERWDKCIDLSLRRIVYGSLAGGGAALLLFRGGCVRSAILALGAGFGAGSAFTDCQRELFESSSSTSS